MSNNANTVQFFALLLRENSASTTTLQNLLAAKYSSNTLGFHHKGQWMSRGLRAARHAHSVKCPTDARNGGLGQNTAMH
ncbi:hypothetical protein ACIS_00183 [Anaplasma centrale str. Israel]|uniref:Uncharacterized protein n=1 Tax=Anaplasma centrale (strain Israel) TaxID=574556 RepID=D1ATI8_ANACI|nr:hypothetical protein ACIS_00183 [Anaplasma centrale str. Israel]